MGKYLILLFLISTQFRAQSQELFYSSNGDMEGDSLRIEIGTFNLLNCEQKELWSDTTKRSNGYIEWVDIALCPDGVLYGLGHDGIYSINLTTGGYSKVQSMPGPGQGLRWHKGMTCTTDTVLIFGERDIFSFDINSKVLTNHGRLPGLLSIWANIFWLNNNLVGSSSDKIVSIDLINPVNSQIYCNLAEQGFLSLTEVAASCDSITVFGFHITGDVYLVNLLDCSIEFYCTVPNSPKENFQGSSPNFEFIAPLPCKIEIDLDSLDLTASGIDSKDTLECELPNTFLSSLINLFSDKPCDSLKIWIETGPSGIYFEGTKPPFAELSGNMTRGLNYKSQSPFEINHLKQFIIDLELGGEMPNGITSVKIGVCAWADNLISDTAYAYITLIGRTTSAGENNSTSLCFSSPPYNTSLLLSSNATSGGFWIPNFSSPGYFSPLVDAPGVFNYIVNDPVCNDDTAQIIIETISPPLFDLGNERLICPGDTVALQVNIPNVNYIWSDGSMTNQFIAFEPQQVWILLTDTLGCLYADTTQITYDDNCLISQLLLPNIFSPNGDGINDYWGFETTIGIRTVHVSLFDRWGNNFFSREAESFSWDGISSSGSLSPPGVYVYLIKITTENNKEFIKSGEFTLIR